MLFRSFSFFSTSLGIIVAGMALGIYTIIAFKSATKDIESRSLSTSEIQINNPDSLTKYYISDSGKRYYVSDTFNDSVTLRNVSDYGEIVHVTRSHNESGLLKSNSDTFRPE